jgi:peptidyl-tRNA hydrolase
MSDDDTDELRMYFIVRRDIGDKMSKAKFGVQCGHAALMLFTETLKSDQARAWQFIEHSQPKIILECADEAELNTLFDMAIEARLPRFRAVKVVDLGRTELGEPTLTAIAIGPLWHKDEANKSFLRQLRLYRDGT